MVWDFDPVAFSFLGLSVRWYGIGYILGFFLVYFGGKYFLEKSSYSVSPKQWEDLVLGTFLAGILGGRLGEFLFFSPSVLWQDPLEVFKIWHGGMSIHGGFLGAILYLRYFCKKHQLSLLHITDAFTIPFSFALALGRITNFINGELVGIPTNSEWGVVFPHVDELLRHPSQLYESASMILMGIVLFLLWKTCAKKSKGFLTIWFLLLYGVFRFIVEFWKDVPEPFFGLSTGQILCLVMIVLARMLSIAIPTRRKKL